MSKTYIYKPEWEKKALEFQTNIATGSLAESTWDRFKINDESNRKFLSDKIQIALFGNQKILTNEKKNLISYIETKFIEKSCWCDAVDLAVIYVSILYHIEVEYIFPIFRIRSNKNNDPEYCCIIDHLGRVYNDLSGYKENNTWDLSYLMLPAKGIYKIIDEKCDVIVLNQYDKGLLKKVADDTATTIGIGSTVGMIAGLGLSVIPVTMPIGIAVLSTSGLFGAASGAYGASKAATTLYDRKKHELPISVFDREARGCWISIVSSSVSAISYGANELLAPNIIRSAQFGEKCSALITGTYTTISITSFSMSAIGFCNLVYDIASKDKITNEDILNLVTTTFFFFHTIIKFETASGVIKKAQSMELSKLKEPLSPEQREIFDSLREAHWETVEPGSIKKSDGDRKFIRELKKIDNLNEFFQQFTLTNDHQLQINGELTIHQRAFVQIPEQERIKILDGLKKLNKNEISLEEFSKHTSNIRKNYLITLDRERSIFQESISNIFGEKLENITVGGKNIFKNLKPHEIDRLHQVTKHSLNNDKNLVDFGKEFASEMKANNVTEFCATSEYAVRQVQREINNRIKQNPKPSTDRGIKVKDFYRDQIMGELRNNNYESLKKSFDTLRENCDVVNNAMLNGFGNSFAAANHYDKHQVLPVFDSKNALTPSQYFEIANDMVSMPNCEIEWTQDGSSLKCTFKNDKLMAIKFYNVSKGESVVATLMDVKKNSIITSKYCYFPTKSDTVFYTDFGMDDMLPDMSGFSS